MPGVPPSAAGGRLPDQHRIAKAGPNWRPQFAARRGTKFPIGLAQVAVVPPFERVRYPLIELRGVRLSLRKRIRTLPQMRDDSFELVLELVGVAPKALLTPGPNLVPGPSVSVPWLSSAWESQDSKVTVAVGEMNAVRGGRR